MTLIESAPYQLIRFNLDLMHPFKSNNEVYFSLSPAENSGDRKTLVIWSITGRDTFISKFFNLLISRDKMIGKQFEEGLANLDLIVKKIADLVCLLNKAILKRPIIELPYLEKINNDGSSPFLWIRQKELRL